MADFNVSAWVLDVRYAVFKLDPDRYRYRWPRVDKADGAHVCSVLRVVSDSTWSRILHGSSPSALLVVTAYEILGLDPRVYLQIRERLAGDVLAADMGTRSIPSPADCLPAGWGAL